MEQYLEQIKNRFSPGERIDYRAMSNIAPLDVLNEMARLGMINADFELTIAYTELPVFWYA